MEIRTLTDANKDVQALLTRTLKIAAEQYYNTGTASMSDFEFDRQAARLKEMEEKKKQRVDEDKVHLMMNDRRR